MSTVNLPSTDPRLAEVTLLTAAQVSELFGLHIRTVWRMVHSEQLPKPVRIGERCVRWRLADLQAFIQGAKG